MPEIALPDVPEMPSLPEPAPPPPPPPPPPPTYKAPPAPVYKPAASACVDRLGSNLRPADPQTAAEPPTTKAKRRRLRLQSNQQQRLAQRSKDNNPETVPGKETPK